MHSLTPYFHPRSLAIIGASTDPERIGGRPLRFLIEAGFKGTLYPVNEVRLLPAAYVRAYVKRNKTDAADASALLEAARCAEIVPVRVKSIEQQALQGLHRTRSLWMGTRTSRINALRGFCREFGIVIAQGSRLGVEQIGRVLADPHAAVPMLIRGTMTLLVEEIRLLEVRIACQREPKIPQIWESKIPHPG